MRPRNQQAVEFHRECQAVGCFPDDEIVRQNANLIAMVDRMSEQKHRMEVTAILKGLMRRG